MEIPSTVDIRFEIATKQKGELLGPFWETTMATIQGHFYCFQFGPQLFTASLKSSSSLSAMESSSSFMVLLDSRFNS